MPDVRTLTKPRPNPDRVRGGNNPDSLTAPLRGGSGSGGPRAGRGSTEPRPANQGQGRGRDPGAEGRIGTGQLTEGSGEGDSLGTSPTTRHAPRRLPSPATPSLDPLAVDLPPSLVAAIERVVEEAGGDRTDALDLAEVWVRILRDCERRAEGVRAAVRIRRCGCADGGEAGGDGRCERCYGALAGGADPDHVQPTLTAGRGGSTGEARS